MEHFLLAMALCHTVHVNKHETRHQTTNGNNGVNGSNGANGTNGANGIDGIDGPAVANGNVGEALSMPLYEASSPDEKTLVEAAAQ